MGRHCNCTAGEAGAALAHALLRLLPAKHSHHVRVMGAARRPCLHRLARPRLGCSCGMVVRMCERSLLLRSSGCSLPAGPCKPCARPCTRGGCWQLVRCCHAFGAVPAARLTAGAKDGCPAFPCCFIGHQATLPVLGSCSRVPTYWGNADLPQRICWRWSRAAG